MEKLSMEELEKLREKKLAERDERIQNITSLIIKLCYVLLAIAVSLMFFMYEMITKHIQTAKL